MASSGRTSRLMAYPTSEVCIGDRYRIGEALFEVSQPRVTCYRVGLRMDEPRMAALLVSHGRPGFYLRVLEEGLVGAGDEIVKVADGPERMSVAEINALLYLPGHRREDLERALRIPALSPGWQASFRALLDHPSEGGSGTGNAGLSAEDGPPPAWAGFRKLRVSRIDRESLTVFSLTLTSTDGKPLPIPLPGQFVVLRLQTEPGAAPLLRSYSLSDAPAADHYRISVKLEEHGAAQQLLAQPYPCRRLPGSQRTQGRIHSQIGRTAGGATQCRRRGHAGSGHAARTRRGGINTRSLVAIRRAQRRGTSFRPRVR